MPRHYYIYGGWVLCLVGLLSSAFCRDVNKLILTQGLLFGVGLLIVEMPTLIILDSWFVKRRGLAYGLLFGLTDLFGVAWGFLAAALLHNHGIRTTFLVFAGVCFIFPALAMYSLRERPASTTDDGFGPEASSSSTTIDCLAQSTPGASGIGARYYRQTTFYFLLASNLLQSIAFYLPFVYLPS